MLRSLTPLVTPQVAFNQIPPAAAGGSFNPDLQDTENTLESHRRQPVDLSIPTSAFNNGKQRLGMNHPPAAAGGINKARTCVNINGGRLRRLISGVSTAENASLDM